MRAIRLTPSERRLTGALFLSAHLVWPAAASAQEPTRDAPTSAKADLPPPSPAPVGISGTLSNSLVLRGNPSESTLLTVLGGAYQWTSAFSTFARVSSVHNSSSDEASATGLANPAVGASLQVDANKHLKVGGISGVTIPIGSGGGNRASTSSVRAWTNSIDWGGAMFAVDHVDVFNGLRGAVTYGPATLQLESTLHELIRVRGAALDPIGASATVTSSTATLSYSVLPQLSFSSGLSETRFWNTPKAIAASPQSRTDYYFIGGVSTAMKVGRVDLTPGLVYARVLDLPLSRQKFQVVELDLGFAL